ncbi:single-stranded-DNA-specific exonuclease RecJ [Candidatus Babeliales bacterium]|nr:single-stranded-DNA-specific exonuclease RecJ [Candidatus Babeliales bacterium]
MNLKDFIQGKKYLLHVKSSNEDEVRKISGEHNLSIPVSQVLFNRGYKLGDNIREFLFTSYEKNVPDGNLLKDSNIAVDRILKAIKEKEKILVFGDYDVDGISSSSLALVCLLPLGAKINFFLPNRARDGYGLSTKIVQRAYENGYKLIITVDNGTTAFEAAALAKKLGLDLIITDHHRPQDGVPEALAVVNPYQDECKYPNKFLPGVGVIFKLVNLLYEKKKLFLPEKAYELLMLGTIADVMPLLGENRYWVRYGLSKANKKLSYAMSVLSRNVRLSKERISSLDIGYNIAPQLNALGRLSDPRDGVKFLISSNRNDVDRVGKVLFEMNEARKRVERQIYDDISVAIDSGKINLEKENLILAAGSGWPTGIVGLVAGKLAHNYGRPAIILHIAKDGLLKGSCRSIKEFNIFDALSENKHLLKTFGGHSQAAGLSIKQENVKELKENLEQKISKELTPFDLKQKVEIDATLQLSDMSKKLLTDLEQLEPFGNENPTPNFLIKNISLLDKPRLLKDKHIKISVFSDGVIKPVIFFNRPDLFTVFNELGEKNFDLAGNVTKNEWEGRTNIELFGVDLVI